MTTIGLKMNKTLDYLDELFPEARCELNYTKDYELLIAVMLSAQTTDKRVNEVTNILFTKYASLEALNKANLKDLIEIVYPFRQSVISAWVFLSKAQASDRVTSVVRRYEPLNVGKAVLSVHFVQPS